MRSLSRNQRTTSTSRVAKVQRYTRTARLVAQGQFRTATHTTQALPRHQAPMVMATKAETFQANSLAAHSRADEHHGPNHGADQAEGGGEPASGG